VSRKARDTKSQGTNFRSYGSCPAHKESRAPGFSWGNAPPDLSRVAALRLWHASRNSHPGLVESALIKRGVMKEGWGFYEKDLNFFKIIKTKLFEILRFLKTNSQNSQYYQNLQNIQEP
jgi:hypothetical protein